MTRGGARFRSRSSLAALSIAACLPGAGFEPALAAQCSIASPCTSAPAAPRLGEQTFDISGDRASKRLNGAGWTAPAWDSAPLQVVSPALPAAAQDSPPLPGPSGSASGDPTALAMQTSIMQWATWSMRAADARLEAARRAAPDAFKLPTATRVDQPLDLWFAMDGKQIGGASDRETSRRLGLDYKLGRSAVVGVAVAAQDKGAGAEQSQTVASYVAVRPLPGVTIDAKGGLAESLATLPGQPSASTGRFVSTSVRGDWQVGSFKLTPSVAFSHGDETPREGATALQDYNRLTFAPKASRPFQLDGGRKIEPFLAFEQKLQIDSAEAGHAGGSGMTAPERSFGAGVSLTKPGSYALNLSTSVTETEKDPAPSLKSRLELKVPLR